MSERSTFAVVGATSLFGRELLAALFDAGVAGDRVTALASERSEGEELDYGDESLEVEVAGADSFRGVNVALLAATPSISSRWIDAIRAAGAWVVDPVGALQDGEPIALSGVTEPLPSLPGRKVRSPGALAGALRVVLGAVGALAESTRVEVTVLAGAAQGGQRGIAELEQQTAALLSAREPEAKIFPHRLAFNVLPQVGEAQGLDTGEELRARSELAGLGAVGVGSNLLVTCLQVPIFHGLVLAGTVRGPAPFDLAATRARLEQAEGVKVLDELSERVYPMPMLAAQDSSVLIGRLRVGHHGELQWVAAVDAVRFAAVRAVGLALAVARRAA